MNFGDDGLERQVALLKKQVNEQNFQLETQKDVLSRKEAEIEENRKRREEAVFALSQESQRAVQLEKDLTRTTTELKQANLKLSNAESALHAANEKLKTEEKLSKQAEFRFELDQQQSMSSSSSQLVTLQKENAKLNQRIIELQLQQQKDQSTPLASSTKSNRHQGFFGSPAPSPARRSVTSPIKSTSHRRRSNSTSDAGGASSTRVKELESQLEWLEQSLETQLEPLRVKIQAQNKTLLQVENQKLSEVRSLNKEINDLKTKLDEMKDDFEMSKDQIRHLEGDQEEFEKLKKSSKLEKERLESLLNSKEEELKELRKKLGGTEADLNEAIAKADHHQESISSLETEKVKLTRKIEEAALTAEAHSQQAIATLKKENSQLLEAAQNEHQLQIVDLENKISSVSNMSAEELKDLKSERDKLKELVDGNEAKVKKLVEDIACIEQELKDNTDELTSCRDELRKTKADFEIYRGEMEAFTTQRDAFEGDLSAVKSELEKKEVECGRLAQSVLELQTEVAKRQEAITSFEAEKIHLDSQLVEAKSKISQLESQTQQVAVLEERIRTRSYEDSEVDAFKSEVAQLQASLDEQAERVRILDLESFGASKSLAGADEESQKLKAEIAALVASQEKAESVQRSQRDEMEMASVTATISLAEMERQKDSLTLVIAETEAKLAASEKLCMELHDLYQTVSQNNNNMENRIEELEDTIRSQSTLEDSQHKDQLLKAAQEEISVLKEREEDLRQDNATVSLLSERVQTDLKSTLVQLQTSLDECSSTVQSLEAKCAAGSAELAEREVKIIELEKALVGRQDEVSMLQVQHSGMESSAAAQIALNNQLEHQVASLKLELDAITADKDLLALTVDQEITLLKAKITNLEDELTRMTTVTESRAEIELMSDADKGQPPSLSGEQVTGVLQMAEVIKRLRNERDSLQDHLNSALLSLEFAELERLSALSQIQTLEQCLSRLELADHQASAEESRLSSKLTEAQSTLSSLNNSFDKITLAHLQTKEQLDSKSRELDDLTVQHQEHQSQLNVAERAASVLRQALKSAQAEISAQSSVFESEKSAVQILRAEVAAASKIETQLRAEVQSLTDQVNLLESQLTALQTNNTVNDISVDEAVSLLQVQQKETFAKLVRRTEAITKQQHEIERLKTNLVLAEDALTELNDDLDAVTLERDTLRAELQATAANLQLQLDEIKSENVALSSKMLSLEDENGKASTKRDSELATLTEIILDRNAQITKLREAVPLTSNYLSSEMVQSQSQQLTVAELSLSLEAASQEIANLKEKIETSVQLYHQLQEKHFSEVSELKDSIHDANQNLQASKQTIIDLESKAEAEQVDKDATLVKVSDLVSQTSQLKVDRDSSNAALCELQAIHAEQLQLHQNAVAALHSAIAEADGKMSDMVEELQRAKTSSQVSGEELSAALASSQQQQVELRAEMEGLATRTAGLENDLKTALDKNEALIQQSELQMQSNEEHTRQVNDFMAQHSSNKITITNLEEQLNEMLASHEIALKSASAQAVAEIPLLQQRLQCAVADLAEREEEISRYAHQITESTGQNTSLQADVTRMTTEVKRCQALVRFSESEAKRSNSAALEASAEVERLQQSLVSFERELKTTRISSEQYLREAQELRKALEVQKEALADVEAKLVEAQTASSNEELVEQVAYLEEDKQELIKRLDNQNVELEEANDKEMILLKDKKKLERKIESLEKKLEAAKKAVTSSQQNTELVPPPSNPPSVVVPIPTPASLFQGTTSEKEMAIPTGSKRGRPEEFASPDKDNQVTAVVGTTPRALLSRHRSPLKAFAPLRSRNALEPQNTNVLGPSNADNSTTTKSLLAQMNSLRMKNSLHTAI